jgi:hypothetical protein
MLGCLSFSIHRAVGRADLGKSFDNLSIRISTNSNLSGETFSDSSIKVHFTPTMRRLIQASLVG